MKKRTRASVSFVLLFDQAKAEEGEGRRRGAKGLRPRPR